jgi:HK97 family phage portal protein
VILQTRQGNLERRMFEASALVPPPGSRMALSGTLLRAQEIGISAVACAIELLSEQIGSFVMRVYEGDAENRRPVLDAQQAQLFQEPGEGETSFDLWADTIVSLELEKAAFLWKTKTSDGVVELRPVDPRGFMVTRRRVDSPRVIKARIDGVLRDVSDKVIFIRSWSPVAGAAEGISKLDLHKRPLRTALALEEYRGRYLENDGTPGLLLDASGSNPTKLQRDEFLESWTAKHSSPENAGKPGIIWGSVKAVTQLAPNLHDSQASELTEGVVREVARMMRIYPAELLHAQMQTRTQPSAEQLSDVFVRFSCLPRMRRIERALWSDYELFPNRKLYPRFDVSELLRADYATTATMIHQLIQVGAITPNEGRAMLGLPPLPGGDEIQQTPVGGAVNQQEVNTMAAALVEALNRLRTNP